MSSHPPAQCCTIGVKHEGEAVGEICKIGGYEAYFSYPKDKSTDTAILILPDVLGHNFPNVQLIADQFASLGYFVVMPDTFHGDTLSLNRPATFDFAPWLAKHGVETVDPIVSAAIEELRGKYGVKKLAAVGYCFGAKYVTRFLKKGGIDVGYVAHPSFVTAEELAAIQGPLSIAAAETDKIFPPEKRHESEVILKDGGLPYQIFLYSGVEHGFAIRADLSSKPARLAKEQAFTQAVNWFNAWLDE